MLFNTKTVEEDLKLCGLTYEDTAVIAKSMLDICDADKQLLSVIA